MSTLKGLLPSVQPQVPRQAALVARAVVAMGALKGLLSSVQPQVRRQAALDARAVVAMSTCIRLLSSVQPQVLRQGALDARAVVAMSTCIRLLSSVQQQVSSGCSCRSCGSCNEHTQRASLQCAHAGASSGRSSYWYDTHSPCARTRAQPFQRK